MQDYEILNIIQEVFRGIVISMTAIDPIKLPDVARLLEACAAREELDPISQKMLADLAAGLTLLGSAQVKSN